MTSTDATVVRRAVTVDAPIQRAFDVFTKQFGDFKPKEHNRLADVPRPLRRRRGRGCHPVGLAG